MAAFGRWLEGRGVTGASEYSTLHAWSTDRLDEFWADVWDFFQVQPSRSTASVLEGQAMPGARWFLGESINYAENALRHAPEAVAVITYDELGPRRAISYGQLRGQVAAAAAWMRRNGVQPGDRVAGVLTNREETVIAFLAAASIGAIWALCAAEFGVNSIVSRLQQIAPRVLIATDAYSYAGKTFDLGEKIAAVRAELPTVEVFVNVPSDLVSAPADAVAWEELLAEAAEPAYLRMPFDHPLWILYSSGTTGIPKAMVHGHGGIVLEHLKNIGLHMDVRAGDTFFWYTTTAWMMWNFLVGGLLVGASIVLYEGPADPRVLWPMSEALGVKVFGASPGFFQATQQTGLHPVPGAALRTLGSTGSPLLEPVHRWMASTFGTGVQIASVSGGTDVCSGFVGPSPTLPVSIGRIQAKMLGVDCVAIGDSGREVVDSIGELVIRKPMPSMPLFFWGDPDGSRMHETYFADIPGVWRHGDWISFDAAGSSVIWGRSDATLNRGGVRMGTSEFYRVLGGIPEIVDELVVDTTDSTGAGGLLLFVVMRDGTRFDDVLQTRIRSVVRTQLSPRHVPDKILQIAEVPYTVTGKKCEIPVKRILQGVEPERAVDLHSLRNPGSIPALVAAARGSRTQTLEGKNV